MERLNVARRQKKVRVGRKVYYDNLDPSLVFSRFSERCAGCPLRGRAACRQRPVSGHPEVQGRGKWCHVTHVIYEVMLILGYRQMYRLLYKSRPTAACLTSLPPLASTSRTTPKVSSRQIKPLDLSVEKPVRKRRSKTKRQSGKCWKLWLFWSQSKIHFQKVKPDLGWRQCRNVSGTWVFYTHSKLNSSRYMISALSCTILSSLSQLTGMAAKSSFNQNSMPPLPPIHSNGKGEWVLLSRDQSESSVLMYVYFPWLDSVDICVPAFKPPFFIFFDIVCSCNFPFTVCLHFQELEFPWSFFLSVGQCIFCSYHW